MEMDDMKTPLRGAGPPGDNEVFGLIMGDDHRYAMWDAAYVLGSLSASDRREFELHMAGCPQCRDAVAELSGVPALLSLLDREEVAAIDQPARIAGSSPQAPEMSPELLPSLLAKVAWRRRRNRVVTWVASSAAAAVLAVGVLIGVPGDFLPPAPQVTASAQPMSQVSTKLLTSEVALSSQPWGPSISRKCVCLAPLNAPHATLAMVVVGRDGSQTRLATWVAEP